ncbi:prolyl oligopeptidase family serine peptidase [Corynebacterium caspium]|uniref:prolyl oligopeptidase family serine peptidase n=1 Tax=Corynebacterium caspium TaxID=234828 RepID=UPI0003650776|nr:prolyl oligopeptidase family serine peptidase [Corynebacterium caspium]WKD59939.1 Prolyl endopeptidase [Corynebacterium caspium DSM 44850]
MSNSPRPQITASELEEIDNPAALAWAAQWSQATEELLETSEYGTYRRDLREKLNRILDADDRLAFVSRRGAWLYNFWRDATHPRGLWRRTDPTSYLSGNPAWEILLDIDELAATEDENWVWKGATVLSGGNDATKEERHALIKLSRGGADAVVVREFDLKTRSFQPAGFHIPAAKTQVSWLNEDLVIIGTDTGPESLTSSGYPREARLWRRGTPLAMAPVILTGEISDVAASVHVDDHLVPPRLIATRALDFYNRKTWVATFSEDENIAWQLLDIPTDCQSLLAGRWLFLCPRTPYLDIPAGALAAIALDDFLKGERETRRIYTPEPQASLQNISFTQNALVLSELHNVATRLWVAPLNLPWELRELPIPAFITATVISTSPRDNDELWLHTSSFIEPASLYRFADVLAETQTPQLVGQAPHNFDATGLETRQHWAISADGTKIPYFITGKNLDSPTPTLVGGYGGFEVSLLPGYSGVRGVAWLEQGYNFVQPALRGGGEFGPQWHSQAVKENREKVFADHQAVLEDLVQRGYARPAQLAIRGGSNGGLLTATALTRYPEAFGAAVIQVPLTDMLRYNQWSAGASWMAEYGDPADPVQLKVLKRYSPLHNVAQVVARKYPPALVTTSTRDDRVHPAHARLFAQALASAGQQVDYFENIEGGHAGAADNAQVAQVESLVFSWLARALQLESAR